MRTINMKYKGFSFDINPDTVSTKLSKNIATRTIPFGFGNVREINDNPVQITASGKIFGSNASQLAQQLVRVFKSKGSAYLYMPLTPPIKVYFNALNITNSAKQECIEYSVEFIEDCNTKNNDIDFGYTYALSGENMYDVSNRCNVSVDKIFDANNYSDLFSLNEGDKVWLS